MHSCTCTRSHTKHKSLAHCMMHVRVTSSCFSRMNNPMSQVTRHMSHVTYHTSYHNHMSQHLQLLQHDETMDGTELPQGKGGCDV